jgi:hypothetical protein
MQINPGRVMIHNLGLTRSWMTRGNGALQVGGLRHATWNDFLFGQDEQGHARWKVTHKLRGGSGGDIDGNSFDVPMQGYEDSPRTLLVLYTSFVDGIDRGIHLPVLYMLKTKFHLSQWAASIVFGLTLAPWTVKPLLALWTDTIPILGYRRKPYLVGSATLNALCLLALASTVHFHVPSILLPMALLTLRTFARAMIDATAQGMLLEDCRGPSVQVTSTLISRFHAAHRLGQFINVCVSGWILSTSSMESVFIGMSTFHVFTIISSLVIPESPVGAGGRFASLIESAQELSVSIQRKPGFYNVLEYAFLSTAIPTVDAPMYYFLLDVRHFTVWQISIVSVFQAAASLVAPIVYSTVLRGSRITNLVTNLTFISIPISIIPLLVTLSITPLSWDLPIVSLSTFLSALVNDLQLLPANVLIARLSPQGLEGSSFSLLTVVEGAGRVTSNVVSALLPLAVGASAPGYQNMSLYVIVCSVFNVGPLGAIEGLEPDEAPTLLAALKPEEEVELVSELSEEENEQQIHIIRNN